MSVTRGSSCCVTRSSSYNVKAPDHSSPRLTAPSSLASQPCSTTDAWPVTFDVECVSQRVVADDPQPGLLEASVQQPSVVDRADEAEAKVRASLVMLHSLACATDSASRQERSEQDLETPRRWARGRRKPDPC